MAHAQKHMDDGPAVTDDLVRLDWFTPTADKVYLEALADAPRARPLPPPVFAPPKNGHPPPQMSYLPPPGPPPDQHRRSVSAPDGTNVPRASTPHHDYLALETSAAEKPAFLIHTPSLSQHRESGSTSSLVVPSPSFPINLSHCSLSNSLRVAPSAPSPHFGALCTGPHWNPGNDDLGLLINAACS